MTTPSCVALPSRSSTTDLPAVDVLRGRCEAYITGELARLASRSPTLGDNELELVSSSIHRVVDRLLLERLRGRSSDHLVALFDLEETP